MERDPQAMYRAFAGACAQPPPADQADEIAQTLSLALLEAEARYPGLEVGDDEFASYVGARMGDEAPTAKSLGKRVTEDLYLACACVKGDRQALHILDTQVLSTLPSAMHRLKIGTGAVEEAVQRARATLLVGQQGEGKLKDFSGTGDLRGWVKVIAIRDALRSSRKEKREVSLSDELAAALPAGGLDPDLAYQQRLYRAEFKASFEAAVDELSPRERSLLRQAIVYRATVDQVALVYQVHRATAARWVAKARDLLATKTRGHLRKRLQLSDSQFVSVVKLIESQMDLSVERLLATADGDEKLDVGDSDE